MNNPVVDPQNPGVDPNATPAPATPPVTDPNTTPPASDPNPAPPLVDPNNVADPNNATDPQTVPPIPTGLPDDAVPLPGETPPAQTEPTPTVDEQELARIEAEVDAAIAAQQGQPQGVQPQGGQPQSGVVQQPAQPEITPPVVPGVDPNTAQPQLGHSQLTPNVVDQALLQRIENLERAQVDQAVPGNPGVTDSYTNSGDPNTYPANDQGFVEDPTTLDPYVQTIIAQNQRMEKFVDLIYQDQQHIRGQIESIHAERHKNEQINKFKEKYPGVDEDTIARANYLSAQGNLIDAVTLIEGRSRAQQAGDQQREIRAQNRELAGQPTIPGGANTNNPADADVTARIEYENIIKMPTGREKDMALINFRNVYGDVAQRLQEEAIGGKLLDAVEQMKPPMQQVEGITDEQMPGIAPPRGQVTPPANNQVTA